MGGGGAHVRTYWSRVRRPCAPPLHSPNGCAAACARDSKQGIRVTSVGRCCREVTRTHSIFRHTMSSWRAILDGVLARQRKSRCLCYTETVSRRGAPLRGPLEYLIGGLRVAAQHRRQEGAVLQVKLALERPATIISRPRLKTKRYAELFRAYAYPAPISDDTRSTRRC